MENPSLPRGVFQASPAAARYKQLVAGFVVIVPFLGVIAAFVLFWNHPLHSIDIGLFLVMYFVCMAGITVGFHRHFAHRSFKAKPWVRWLLGISGSMAAQGPLLFWVSTHRRHHRYSDAQGDPHSPNLHGEGLTDMIKGLWHAHVGWMFSRELSNPAFFAPDCLRDDTSFRINETYFIWVFSGLLIPAAVGGLVQGSWMGAFSGFLWGGLVRMFLCNHAAWCVGSISHVYGSKRFLTGDRSANNWLVAVLAFGEGLQNNHHAFPGSPNHMVKWWEPDISAWIIKSMAWIGLLYDLRYPQAEKIDEAAREFRQAMS
jgi:stearoyl-CoA desaturase (delta-9 desaturase)